jgi:hypothetical protein
MHQTCEAVAVDETAIEENLQDQRQSADLVQVHCVVLYRDGAAVGERIVAK